MKSTPFEAFPVSLEFKLLIRNNVHIDLRLMALLIPRRDKKMIVWNFMEELWRKYQRATTNGQQPTFHLDDFHYLDVFEEYLPKIGIREFDSNSVILDTLEEYKQRGYYRIEGDNVTLTESGLAECRKPIRDWD